MTYRVNEFNFIQSIQQNSYRQSTLEKGIGDDAAVFYQPSKKIVAAVDTFVENVHFSRKTMTPFQAGYRSLAANLSDIAAMGATPAFVLTSIVIPKTWDIKDVQQTFNGIKCLAKQYQVDLIGGDTVSGQELSITITIIGYVKENKVRYRSLAKPRDVVFVTGTVGDSQAGLHILTHPNEYTNKSFFIQRHQKPQPRVEFAQNLTHIKRVCLNDVSDGIGNETIEIAEASNVQMLIHENLIPTSKDFAQFDVKLQRHWKLFGGEDFELLGTVSPKDWPKIKRVAERLNLRVTQIGEVLNKKGGKAYVKRGNDNIELLRKDGYRHLK